VKQSILLAPEANLEIPDIARLEIRATKEGAPRVFLDGEALPLAISLSHRAGAGLCVLSPRGPVGCDLEWIEDRSTAFVEDYFTAAERSVILERGAAMQGLMANALWCAKESVLKVMGVGLRLDTRSLSVRTIDEPCPDRWESFTVRYSRDEREFQGWWRLLDNWILTVVAESNCRYPMEARRG